MRHRIASNPRLAIGLFGGWLLIIAGLLVIAPEEKTLGTGIKVVYVHVAMIWTGMDRCCHNRTAWGVGSSSSK